MKYITIPAIVIVAALGACTSSGGSNDAQSAGNMSHSGSMAQPSDPMAAGSGAVAAVDADTYIAQAAFGDMYEVQSSQLAVRKSANPRVTGFARQMIDDHTRTSAKLMSTASAAGRQAPPAALDARRQAMIDSLNQATGADFDRAYLSQQVAAHQEALALHTSYARGGDNQALRSLAASTAPVVEHHYAMVSKMNDDQGNQTR